jgi:hypothetical protein
MELPVLQGNCPDEVEKTHIATQRTAVIAVSKPRAEFAGGNGWSRQVKSWLR